MNTIRIYGASDDLIEFEGDFEEEYPAWRNSQGSFVIGGILRIKAFYDGTWFFSVGMVSEDFPIPDSWSISIKQAPESGHSMMVIIETDQKVSVIRELETEK